MAAAVVVLVLCRWLDPAWPAAVLTLAGVALLAGPLPTPTISPRLDADALAVGTTSAAVATVIAALACFLCAGRHVPEHGGARSAREVVAT